MYGVWRRTFGGIAGSCSARASRRTQNPPVPQIMHQRGPTAWNYGGVGGFLCRPTPMAWHRQYGSVPRLHLPGYISPSSSSRWSHFHRHFRFHRSSFVPSLGAVLSGVPSKTRIRIKFFSIFAGHNEAFVSAAASKEQGGMTFCRLPRTPPGAWLSVSPEKAQVPGTLQGKGGEPQWASALCYSG